MSHPDIVPEGARVVRSVVPSAPAWQDSVAQRRPKVLLSLRLDADVLAFLRAEGPGYQTRANAILRSYMLHVRRGEGGT